MMLSLLLIFAMCLSSCKPDEINPVDRRPSHKYAPSPSDDLSLKDYNRLIISRFQIFEGLDCGNLAIEFPQNIYNKVNFYYPRAFDDVRLWEYDRPGLLLTGFVVEYYPTSRLRRLLPAGRGTAVLGLEIVLRDNISGRGISRFSYRYPYPRPDKSIESLLDETARKIAGYLAYCRKY